MKTGILFFLLLVFSSSRIVGQIFSDQTEQYGIANYCQGEYGNGVSAFDWNNDGWDDLVLLRDNSIPMFYENNHNGFTQVFFNGLSEQRDIKSVYWVDFDNDGNLDLSINSLVNGMSLYHRTGPNSFQDITASAGILKYLAIEQGYGQAWGDFDKDGDLDFYHCNYNSVEIQGIAIHNHLYRNNGDLTFTDITAEAGIHLDMETSFLAVWTDYNNDTWPDLFIVNDRGIYPNHMYRNNADGTFTNVSQQIGVDHYMDAMSGTFGDYNNDGNFDVYITNTPEGNKLLKNDDGVNFADMSVPNNVQFFQWCWSSSWIDYDCDGWQDLMVSCSPAWQFPLDGNHFILQNQQHTFSLMWNSGFGEGASQTFSSARGDFNNDGYPDLVTHSELPQGTQIWINNATNAGNWLKVRLQAVISNPQAVGVLISAHTGESTQYRYSLMGEQYLSQNSQWEFFGFGQTNQIDSLVVLWPSGLRDVLYNIPVNQAIVVTEGLPQEPAISLVSGSLSFCYGDSVVFDAGIHDSYYWHTGETTRFITVHESDSVYVRIIDDGISQTLTAFVVTVFSDPVQEVISPDRICNGSNNGSIQLNVSDPSTINQITWSNGETGFEINNLEPGSYEVMIDYGPSCQSNYFIDIGQFAPFLVDSVLFYQSPDLIGCQSGWSATNLRSGGVGQVSVHWTVFDYLSSQLLLDSWGDTLLCLPASPPLTVNCIIEDEAGCSHSKQVIKDFPLTAGSVKSNLFMFPNPVNEELTIRGLKNAFHQINIFDNAGRLVMTTQATGDLVILNCSQLGAGLYHLSINNHELPIHSTFVKN